MYSDKDNLGFGIRIDDMFPGAWSFGISLSHSMDETYVFINLFKKTVVIGWIYKEYNYEEEE